MMWPHEWYGTMFLGPLMMLPFIAAIGVLVFLGVRWVGGSGRTVRRHHRTPSSPLTTSIVGLGAAARARAGVERRNRHGSTSFYWEGSS